MKVYVKNKLISFGDGSAVVDETGAPAFQVKGRVFSPTRVKFVCDMAGNRLYKVRNKWLNFFVHKAYIYDAGNNKIATVKDKFFTMRSQFFVVGYQHEIKVEGKLFSATSAILRDGQPMGTLRRMFEGARTFFADSFELEADERDIPFLIALVIAIDNIVDKRTK